jgi:hypothetical protein
LSKIFEDAKASVLRGEHVIGSQTKYEILTIKNHNHHYMVIVRESTTTIVEEESYNRLDSAKKLGVKLLLDHRQDASASNTSMVHYKKRENNAPWEKDKKPVLEGLFQQYKQDPFKNINLTKLHQILKNFTSYRQTNEDEYQNQERKYKVDFFNALGSILRQIESNAEEAKEQLHELITKKQSESVFIRWWDNLISAFSGYSQRDDFRVYLENIDEVEFEEVFTLMFEEGITSEVRSKINNRFKFLFDQGKMAPAKKSYSNPSVQFLAVLLSSYSPNEYSLYKSTEYTNFAQAIGLLPDNDAIKKYLLFNKMSIFILGIAKENNYKVDDLIDVHNLIYLYDVIQDNPQGVNQSMTKPKNSILYGPPGTGKTYNVIYEALKILVPGIDPTMLTDTSRRDEAIQLYKKFVESNQIMFCTFHQSFSYEDFVEGIRFNKDNQSYEVRDGVFKRICNAARASITDKKKTYNFNPDETEFFKMSLGNIYETEDDIFNYCIENNLVALGWGDEVDFSICTNKQEIKNAFLNKYPDGRIFAIEAMERFKHWMDIGDIVVISSGNNWVRAIGKVTGEYIFDPDRFEGYKHFREVEWLLVDTINMIPVERILKAKIFSQQSIYKFYDQDLNMESLLELIADKKTDGAGESQYVLIIDEINRGNISKIFGELITLIEPDKRMGQLNELSVTLPYSDAINAKFTVPSNVNLLGTMNTADRSIALLDTALRRRFEFKEMMPDYTLLPDNVEGINISKLLKSINDRIEYLYDRDHQIGHAYFMVDEPTAEHYKNVMLTKVIPLLQEYFYENWESIELVLGGVGKLNNRDYLLNKVQLTPKNLFSKSSQVVDLDKYRYSVQDNPSNLALIRIYENGTADVVEEQDDVE